MGKPFNSAKDDFSFFMSRDLKKDMTMVTMKAALRKLNIFLKD